MWNQRLIPWCFDRWRWLSSSSAVWKVWGSSFGLPAAGSVPLAALATSVWEAAASSAVSKSLPSGAKLPRKPLPLSHPLSHGDAQLCASAKRSGSYCGRTGKTSDWLTGSKVMKTRAESHHGYRWTFCMDAECPCMCVILYASATASVLACRVCFYKYMSKCVFL